MSIVTLKNCDSDFVSLLNVQVFILRWRHTGGTTGRVKAFELSFTHLGLVLGKEHISEIESIACLLLSQIAYFFLHSLVRHLIVHDWGNKSRLDFNALADLFL